MSASASAASGVVYKWMHLSSNNCERRIWETLNVEEALASLEGLAEQPSVDNLVCILQKCRKRKNLALAKRVHEHICNNWLQTHRVLGNHLVPLFVECGSVSDAQQVFDRLRHRNEFSWTSLIQGYNDCGESHHALYLFEKMREDGVHPSRFTFVALLKACTRIKCIQRGQEMYAEIAKQGFERDPFVGSILVDMYAKCGALIEAIEVFSKLPVRDAVLWTALIAGYAEHGPGEEALNCLELMQMEGIFPDAVTLVCSLKACGSIGAMYCGQELHTEITKQGYERDPLFGSALVDMYAKCGSLAEAQEAFDKLDVGNVVSWTALIAGYAELGLGEEALKCFEWMQEEGVPPNIVTFLCGLKACASAGAIEKGRCIHMEIAKQGFEIDQFVGNTLVDMYAKCDSLGEAEELFNELPVRSVVSWNALITGYAEYGLGEEALSCLAQMESEGVSPNAVTVVSSLKACASIGAVDRGREIHRNIDKGLERDHFVDNALVDMYAKCGSLAEAQEVFDELPAQDLVSWTALIAGYARQGESEIAFLLFERMKEVGIRPDGLTFLNILIACSHGGHVDKGQKYFETMREEYGVSPTIEHHNCMLDLLSRAGQINEAVAMLEKMPCQPDLVTWSIILGACQKWHNVELGRHAFENAVKLDDKYVTAFVLMSNIYADAHMWEEQKKIEAMKVKIGE